MTQATIPLSSFQVGAEAVAGTAVAATRKIPILVGSGLPDETIERSYPKEQRNSLIENYRSFPVRRMAAVSVTVAPTYQHLPMFLNHFLDSDWNGAATLKNGTPFAITAKRYQFQPHATQDRLLTSTLEGANPTQAYEM